MREFQQARRESALGSDSENASPPVEVGGSRRLPQTGRMAAGTDLGQLPEECRCFPTPDDEMAAPGTLEFRFFACKA